MDGTDERRGSSADGLDTEAGRLRIAVSRMARRLRPTAAAGSLTSTEVDMLVVAENRGPARMSDFASFCGLNPTMVSRLVPKLEDAGYLETRPDPEDKRARRVKATKKASKLLTRIRAERSSVLADLIGELDQMERHALFTAIPVLEHLAERLNKPAPAPGDER